ncbi:hypothetical protein PV11_08763 [Exophiala sideris]|uniref:Uncharacterized protein n=1 Tax=Exophiala sideris TaxID=1016849 RepID=A0A0D1Y7V6_9EURO|nr:hypothetical protein PV11_08763 [Exophiala sideris]
MFLPGDEHEIDVLGIPQRVRMVYDVDGVTPLHDNRKREAIVFEILQGGAWVRLNGTVNGPTDLRNEIYAHFGLAQPAGVQGTWALFRLIRQGVPPIDWNQERQNWHNRTYIPYLQQYGPRPGVQGVGLGSGGRRSRGRGRGAGSAGRGGGRGGGAAGQGGGNAGRGGGRGGGAAGRGSGRGGGPAPGLGPVPGVGPAAGGGRGGGGGGNAGRGAGRGGNP